MIYTGKSTACHTCRQRRLKCDEARPSCLKCIRAGRECKGYRDGLPFIICNMASATIQKSKGRKRSSISSDCSERSTADRRPSLGPLPADSDHWTNRTLSRSRNNNARPQKLAAPRLCDTTISLPVDDQALCYFANSYASAPTQILDPGYLPVLKLIINHRKDVGQCLLRTVSAVSLAAFSTRPSSRRMLPRACAVYSTVLRLTNEEIQRPGSCGDDELLASVVLLALFEIFTSDGLGGWSSHIYGAAAMIGARGKVCTSNKFSKALLRVISNESVKLRLLGFSSPHTGTENWLNWLSDPTYTTYVTPSTTEGGLVKEEEAAESIVEPSSMGIESAILEQAAPVSCADAIEHVRSGREGTLPVPNLPNYPLGRSQPRLQDDEGTITNTLNEIKLVAEAYSKYRSTEPGPATRASNGSRCDGELPQCFANQTEGERQTRLLGEISLHICACTARMVTYNVMARCAAASPAQAQDYSTAVSMGKKEISEIVRFIPYFYALMEGTPRSGSYRFGPPASVEDYCAYASDSSDSPTDGDFGWPRLRRSRQVPHLARNYIGFMILWPLATAATTDLVDENQFAYIAQMQEYITQRCGIRIAKGVQRFCMEKRQMSGVAFYV